VSEGLRALGWSVGHLLWQGLLIGMSVALVLRRSFSSAARFKIATGAACLVLLLLPINVLVYYRGAFVPVAHLEAIPGATRAVSAFVYSDVDILLFAGLVWLVAVAVGIARLVLAWRLARRQYLASARIAREQIRARVGDVAHRHGLPSPVVLENIAADSPAVIGCRSPVLVLPPSMAALSEKQFDGIIAHELAHIARRDGITDLLHGLLKTLLFFQPAVHVLVRIAREERELVCDARGVAACGSVKEYVSALLCLEVGRTHGALAVLAARTGALLPRVRRLIEQRSSGINADLICGAATMVLCVLAATATALPALRGLTHRIAAVERYMVRAADPAGRFTITFHRGTAAEVFLETERVDPSRIVQRRDSLYILNPAGSVALALHTKATGGISWSPRFPH